MDDEKAQTQAELLNALHLQVVNLQDALTLLFNEALAADQEDCARPRSDEARQMTLERIRDASQRVVQGMAEYHAAYAEWVMQFEQVTFEAIDGQQVLRELLAEAD
ncbi:MAG: hypothetical protein ACYDCO_15930 [Armatimonadota bacterium]